MLDHMPSDQELRQLLGQSLLQNFHQICGEIEKRYEMEQLWNRGGKAWTYEYKYRRGGKTLCALYMAQDKLGFMVILGKEEQVKFEAERDIYSEGTRKIYDETSAFHDGKWLMLLPAEEPFMEDILNLLSMKRKPNRKG